MVKKNFRCRAWITGSQSYDVKKLLKNMIKQICTNATPDKDEADEIQELITFLRNYLETEKYMVVIDDVWDVNLWEIIRHALPKNDKGSRVIFTTCNDIISVVACQETSCDVVRRLQPLSEEMAWDLFYKKAFQYDNSAGSSCPKELEEVSHKLIGKCQGLPLVITAIARLMATKEKTMLEWQKVLDNISSELESNPQLTSISRILSLSYNDLPHHLKSCFLYFGIFPQDYLISESRLQKLWIAEGFVKPKRGKLLEDIAKEYLEELIHRNLVQASYFECSGNNKICIVHDMMREIILPKIDELGFCQILDKKNTTFRSKFLRLSIFGSEENVLGIVEDSTVRSIFVFNLDKLTESFVATLFKKFKLLRVLDFEDAPLDYLPKEVGNFFHLKYLGLRKTKVIAIPKSVAKLQNLQTLNLSTTLVRELPFEITSLPHMRHFNNSYQDKSPNAGVNSRHGVKIPSGIGSLEDLQTLNRVEAYNNVDAINELAKLIHLRVLYISMLTTETGRALCSISRMEQLDRLELSLISEDEIFDLESVSSPPRFPHWIVELRNLLELKLAFSNLQEDPLISLHSLPNLQKLVLHQAYNGEQLLFEEGSFGKLKELSLTFLVRLKAVEIDRGALPRLEKLVIGNSSLKPSGIEQLTNLKTLRFRNMSEEFISAIDPEKGPDYGKVMHVSSITIWEKVSSRVVVSGLRDSDPFNICCTKHFEFM